MKSQIQNEELIKTLNKSIRNQGTYFVVIINKQSSQNDQCTYLVLPCKVWENFFQKKAHEKTKTFLGKKKNTGRLF